MYNKTDTNSTSSLQNLYGESKGDILIRRFILIPIIIVLAIIPLIMHSKSYPTNLTGYDWFSNEETKVDYFLYYKHILMVVMAITMTVFLAITAYFKRSLLKFKSIFIPLLVYFGFATLSTIFSKYISFGTHGVYDSFETIFVLFGYVLVCIYTYIFTTNEKDLNFILKPFLISLTILSILGILQYIGHDFFTTKLGLKMVLSDAIRKDLTKVDLLFGKHRVYMTLFNPNYVGVYTSMVLPVLFFLFIYGKKGIKSIWYVFLIASMAICLYGSKSKSGMIAVAVTIFFIILLMCKKFLKNKGVVLATALLFVAAVAVAGWKLNIADRLHNAFSSAPTFPLQAIDTNDDNIVIHYLDNELKIQYTTDGSTYFDFQLTDQNDTPLTYTLDDTQVYHINDDRFADITLQRTQFNDLYGFGATIEDNPWYFFYSTADKTYYYLNPYGKLVKMLTSKGYIFKNPALASGRGYIWSRTLPLLKDHIILGSGAESFVFDFPNSDDYVLRHTYGFGLTSITNKPHNLYLQIAVEYGMVALIAFLVFFLIYFIWSIKIYFKTSLHTLTAQLGVGAFLGTTAYMICGLTNDSSLTISPVFYVLLGLGISANTMLQKSKQQ